MRYIHICIFFVLLAILFNGCGSPLARLLTTGNPSIPDSEIMDDGYYFVSEHYYGIFGPVKYYKNTPYGKIQSSYLSAVYNTYSLELSSSVAVVNGPYLSEDYANRERKTKIDYIKWQGSGNYREISYQ
ncbi:MAG: hypothetical protein IPH11_19300 [Ignavibacteriales bacterium]|nr:hypothetical protein [Ignavibacteriales bacterium]